MSQSKEAALFMLGKGWFDYSRLSKEMKIDKKLSSQLIQRIKRCGDYDTVVKKENNVNHVKVIRVGSKGEFFGNDPKLWRLALFGSAA